MSLLILYVLCGISASLCHSENAIDASSLKAIVSDLKAKIQAIETELESQQRKHKDGLQTLKDKANTDIAAIREQYESRLAALENTYSDHTKNEPDKYVSSSVGCNDEVINLSCPGAKTIYVEEAYYGQFATACETACCVPHPFDDCKELMEDNSPPDWLALKLTCDGQRSCNISNPGGILPSCADPYVSDYALIHYLCYPEEEPYQLPVAFTAYATTTRTYQPNQIVIFDTTTTNVGNYFIPDTSYFLCPQDGVYVFFASLTSPHPYYMFADIMLEQLKTVSTISDDYLGNQGSAMAVVNCGKGQRVWVQATYTGSQLVGGDDDRLSTFSGFLAYVVE